MNYIFIVSDGTGKTAEQALQAALVQFPAVEVVIRKSTRVNDKDEIVRVVDEARRLNGFLVHTLVSHQMRNFMILQCRLNNVENIDLMGPFLSRLSTQLAISPSEKPGLMQHLNEEYFRRVETMNFAFKHDDGQRPEELEKAEIVLLGVSRTFKTPLSVYLAFKRWLVANVPIIYNIPPPAQIFALPPDRVFCLTTNPARLTELRQVRRQKWGDASGDYARFEFVKQELAYASDIFARNPEWTKISVTNKAIEEIASEIIVLKQAHSIVNKDDHDDF